MTQQRQSWWRNGVAADHISIGVRGGSRPFHHHRRSKATRGCSILNIFWVFLLCLVLLVATFFYILLQSKGVDIDGDGDRSQDDGSMASDYVMNATRLEGLEFGAGSVRYGQDSRYWDKDDRRRDEDYDEELLKARIDAKSKALKDLSASETSHKVLDHRDNGFSEMARYEKKQDKTEDNAPIAKTVKFQDDDDRKGSEQLGNNGKGKIKEVEDDEYDDGVDMEDDDYVDSRHDHKDQSHANKQPSLQIRESSHEHEGKRKNLGVHMTSVKQSNLKKKPKHRKFRGACDMKISNSSALIVEPLESRKFARFTLLYTEQEEKPIGDQKWEPRFAGHQTLKEREESFTAHDQKINCGFVKGPKGSKSTGFDLEEHDMNYISSCHIAVMSCIFGNSDRLRSPLGRKVSRLSRKNICFVMFMDEETMQTLSAEGQQPDTMGFVGLWKIVVVKNLPYADMRRVGKIPKFLSHRLFPSARYSIWLDSKLRLQLDPMLILEYFLWRKGYEYAISNHYDRHCLWEEVAQNKRLNKYNHSIIDEQFAFYQADGMKRFNASDPDKLLPSNVPEGSFIVRAHTPMSNLFSCLWFNEVDRFTPRDQLSFAYTYHKLRRKNPEKPFFLNMFKDCERRKIAKLYHHRSEERTIPASTI